MPPVPPTPLMNMFNRLDTDHNGAVNAAEMKGMLQRARVSPMVVDRATSAMMEKLDGNANGQIDSMEFGSRIGGVLFMYVKNAREERPTPAELPAATDNWFSGMDANRDNKVNVPELKAELLEQMERDGTSFPDMASDAAARMGIYLIDENADGSVARAELAALVEDMARGPQR